MTVHFSRAQVGEVAWICLGLGGAVGGFLVGRGGGYVIARRARSKAKQQRFLPNGSRRRLRARENWATTRATRSVRAAGEALLARAL